MNGKTYIRWSLLIATCTCVVTAQAANYSVIFYEFGGSGGGNFFDDYAFAGAAVFEIDDSAVTPDNLVLFSDKDGFLRYRASKLDCRACSLKEQCCPNVDQKKLMRSQFESARDVARAIARTGEYRRTRRQRKMVEMLFAHMKRILKMDRLRLRGLTGANDEFLLTATAQNLRRMAQWLGTGPPEMTAVAMT